MSIDQSMTILVHPKGVQSVPLTSDLRLWAIKRSREGARKFEANLWEKFTLRDHYKTVKIWKFCDDALEVVEAV